MDLESLSTEKLIEINRMTAAIVQSRRAQETSQHLAQFHIGDHVQFTSTDGTLIKGLVVRVNRKSISIDAYEPHGHWRVSPQVVQKIESSHVEVAVKRATLLQ